MLVGPRDQKDLHDGHSWVIKSWEFVTTRKWWNIKNSLPETLNKAVVYMAKHHATIMQTQTILNATVEAAKNLHLDDFNVQELTQ